MRIRTIAGKGGKDQHRQPCLYSIMKRFLSILCILLTIAILTGCKKDSFITGSAATLTTSEDSLHFDTLFTTTGSVTHFFKVYNTNDQKLRITAITLSGGS